MQPTPKLPTNACPFNTYVGIDRGLFMTRRDDLPIARVHNARWTVVGPAPSPGVLEFSLMGYATQPVTAADYQNGTLLLTSEGSDLFNCLTRGPVVEPIIAEYFATEIYLGHYSNGGPKLTQDEIDMVNTTAQRLVVAMGGKLGVTSVEMTVDFVPDINGLPIMRGAVMSSYKGVKNGTAVEARIPLTAAPYDPVSVALDQIRNA